MSGTRESAVRAPLLPASAAWQSIAAALRPPVGESASEAVRLADAPGRVLAVPVHAPRDVPGHTNAAVDGYACAARATSGPAQDFTPLRVAGKSMAGAPFAGETTHRSCIRIMTGAVVPAGLDAVVMQEDVREPEHTLPGVGETVHLPNNTRAGQNVRQRGEDIAQGAEVLRPGTRLLGAHVGLLASMGLGQVRVHRRLRVALMSTGDELRLPGEELPEGGVYDTNRPMLEALLTQLPVDVVDLGIIRDDREALSEALCRAAAQADVVLTSGGASTGEADFVKPLLDELGSVGFWRIAVRPGRPLAFGHLGNGAATFFGLPGNPVAVLVTYWQFVAPALRRLAGETGALPPPALRARLVAPLRKKAERLEFYRAVVSRNEHDECVVQQTGRPGSGLLHTVTDANCFIMLAHDAPAPAVGDWVDVQPFFGLA